MKIGIVYDDNGYINDFLHTEDGYKIIEVSHDGELYIDSISFRDGECTFKVVDDISERVKLEKINVSERMKFDNRVEVDVYVEIVRNKSCKMYLYNGLNVKVSTDITKQN